nr:hypothetical protein [Burkholderia sp. GbtcB21]
MRDRRHPLAIAVVAVGRREHLAVRDAVVVRRQIDRHRAQAPGRIVAVAHRGRRALRAVRVDPDRAQLRKPPGRVVEIRRFAAGRRHATQQARAIVCVVDFVAVAVRRRDKATATRHVVNFGQLLATVPPSPLPRSGVVGERRPRTGAARRDIEPPLSVITVDDRRAVPVGARDRAARLVQLAGQRANRARAAGAPAVGRELSLAVVGTMDRAGDSASDQHQVAILDDQVAVRRIDIDSLARLTRRRFAKLAACAETQCGRRLQTQPVTRDDRYHVPLDPVRDLNGVLPEKQARLEQVVRAIRYLFNDFRVREIPSTALSTSFSLSQK